MLESKFKSEDNLRQRCLKVRVVYLKNYQFWMIHGQLLEALLEDLAGKAGRRHLRDRLATKSSGLGSSTFFITGLAIKV